MNLISKSNALTIIILVFIIWRQLPVIINNYQSKGTAVASKSYQPIFHPTSDLEVEFPPTNKKAIAIFWATWCGPCKVEMNRLKDSIVNKKISAEKVYAINPFESANIIKDFLNKNKYPFIFIDAPELTKRLNVQVTPTTIFIDNNKITTMGSGMSLVGIWRAEWFLSED